VKNDPFDLADVNARRLGECQDSDFVALCLSIYQSLSSQASFFFPRIYQEAENADSVQSSIRYPFARRSDQNPRSRSPLVPYYAKKVRGRTEKRM